MCMRLVPLYGIVGVCAHLFIPVSPAIFICATLLKNMIHSVSLLRKISIVCVTKYAYCDKVYICVTADD